MYIRKDCSKQYAYIVLSQNVVVQSMSYLQAVFMALVVNMEDRILAVTAENAPEGRFPLVRTVVILLIKLPPLAYMV
jgi:DICT domain-containing protein